MKKSFSVAQLAQGFLVVAVLPILKLNQQVPVVPLCGFKGDADLVNFPWYVIVLGAWYWYLFNAVFNCRRSRLKSSKQGVSYGSFSSQASAPFFGLRLLFGGGHWFKPVKWAAVIKP